MNISSVKMPRLQDFTGKVRHEFAILLLSIVLIPVILILIILHILSLIAQKLVIIIAKIFRPDLSDIFAEPMGVNLSSEYIYRRPKSNVVVHYICDGQIQLEYFRRQFQQRIINCCDPHGNLKYRKLRQTWTQFCGFMFWKWDKNFDLSNHIRMYDYTESEIAIPSPCTEEDLRRIAGNLVSRPYVKGRSPWEILIIPDYLYVDSEDGQVKLGSVYTLRIHHALADGFSLFKLWVELFDPGFKIPSANFPKLSTPLKILRFFLHVFKFPYDLAKTVLLFRDDANSWHIVDKKLTRRYAVLCSDRIPVSTIKAIKNKYGIGYNTAVYAITAGTISRIMKQTGQKVPKAMTCTIPYPLPNHPGGLVNHL